MGTLPTLDELIKVMLEDRRSWEILFAYVVEIMTRKESEDALTLWTFSSAVSESKKKEEEGV